MVKTFSLHLIHIKAKSEKHTHNMKTIFYSYDCISINAFRIHTPHTGCKLISYLTANPVFNSYKDTAWSFVYF